MKRTIATLGVVGLGLMGATVAANAAPDDKITICHATGSASNPYLVETINLNALSAHVGDTGDIVPANSGNDMPYGQNITPANLILLANNCVVPPVPVDPGPVDPGPVDPGTGVTPALLIRVRWIQARWTQVRLFRDRLFRGRWTLAR